MAELAQGDALSTHKFGVQLGGIVVESIKEISSLTVEQEVVENRSVSPQGKLIVRKQPGARMPGEVTLTRGLDKSDALTEWINMTLNNGAVDTARQNITIEVMDATGTTVRRIDLNNAWASKWEGPSLTAGQSAAATENVTIVFEGIQVE
jgi:phage tail-like protein